MGVSRAKRRVEGERGRGNKIKDITFSYAMGLFFLVISQLLASTKKFLKVLT